MVYGIGIGSCGTYTSEYAQFGGLYSEWVKGVITEYNLDHNDNILKNTDQKGEEVWVYNYCVAHPADTFFLAVIRFIKLMQKEK
jgi:hypothetical protein